MNLFAPLLSFTASGLLVILSWTCIIRGRFNLQKLFFIATALSFAFITLLLGFLLQVNTPAKAHSLLRLLLVVTLSSSALGLSFFYYFASDRGLHSLKKRLLGIITLLILLAAGGMLLPLHHLIRSIAIEENGFFYQIDFTWAGKTIGVFFLIVNVCYLFFLENTYRAANIQGKVPLKYPVLGILIASLLNFIVMSRLLSLSSIDRRFLTIESCGVIIVAISFLYANLRGDSIP